MCGELEDVEHMIYKCRWTRPIWFGGQGLIEQQHERTTMEEWFQDRRNERNVGQQQLETRWGMCMMLCWRIWKGRCLAAYEGKQTCPWEVLDSSRKELTEIVSARSATTTENRMPPRQVWIKPEMG